MSGEPLLRIEALAGGYGPTRILHGVDLAVPAAPSPRCSAPTAPARRR
jgi:hypothetical protein